MKKMITMLAALLLAVSVICVYAVSKDKLVLSALEGGVDVGVIRGFADNTIDLGTSAIEFRNLYIDGTAKIDTLIVDVLCTIGAMYALKLTIDGDPTSTPTAIGILMIDTANDCELYISTGTSGSAWEKVGAQ